MSLFYDYSFQVLLVSSLQQTDNVRVAFGSGNVDGSHSTLCREANMTSCSNCTKYTLYHDISDCIMIVQCTLNTLYCVVQSPYRGGQVDTGSCPDEIVHHISVAIETSKMQRCYTILCVCVWRREIRLVY